MAEKRRRGIFRSRDGEPADDVSPPDDPDPPADGDVDAPEEAADTVAVAAPEEAPMEEASADADGAAPKKGTGRRMMNWLGYGLDEDERAGTGSAAEPEAETGEPQTEVQAIPEEPRARGGTGTGAEAGGRG